MDGRHRATYTENSTEGVREEISRLERGIQVIHWKSYTNSLKFVQWDFFSAESRKGKIILAVVCNLINEGRLEHISNFSIWGFSLMKQNQKELY